MTRYAPVRTRQLGAIHAEAKRLGLDDSTYRDLLERVASVRSAAKLDASGRCQVLDELRRLAGGIRRQMRNAVPPPEGAPANVRDEVAALVGKIGHHQRSRDRVNTDMNDQLAIVRERYEAQAKPHADAIIALTKGVQLYCEAHRDELTRAGKVKTHTFASGEVKWRMRPPSVVVRGIESVIEALKQLKLERFVRTKEEVNRDAILADPDAVTNVKGISIRQTEDFVVQPWETELEEVA